MVERVLAGVGLAVCLMVWLGMALGPQRRRALAVWPRTVWRRVRIARRARREALSAIERARRRPPVDREGNVYRPKSFDRRGDDDTLH